MLFSRSRPGARVFAVVLLALAFSTVHAATFVVTRVDDPNPASCTVASCSLREAVLAANASPGVDRIDVPAGQYFLTLGEMSFTDHVVLSGAGRNSTRITGDGSSPMLRATTAISLTVQALSLLGPPAQPFAERHPSGANLAIFCGACSRLSIVDALVTYAAGDVLVGGGFPSAALAVDRSVIAVVVGQQSSGTVRVSDSALQFLQVGIDDDAVVDVLIERSNFTLDLAPDFASGVVMFTAGSIDIVDSEIASTTSGFRVSGVSPSRIHLGRFRYLDNELPVLVAPMVDVSIVDSEFRDNTSSSSGPGALQVDNGSRWTVSGSSFIGNRGNGDTGGAIEVADGAILDIDNSTFSVNSFTVAAAANAARGAAIGVRGGALGATLNMRHVTIVQPTFALDGIEGTTIGARGTDAQSSISIYNSILRGNCRLDAGLLDTGIGNVESIGNTCSLSTSRNQVMVSVANLALGTLEDHGGPTVTYQPAANSVAVDYVWTDLECTPRDQRGYLRLAGTDCDIGAVEVGGLERIFVDGFE